jgi:hypothetical protein
MKSTMGWIFAVVMIVALVFALPFAFRLAGWDGYGGFGRFHGMMGDGFGYFSPFGFLGMGLMMLVPLGLIVLLVLGGVALVNSLTRPGGYPVQPVSPGGRPCPNCSKPTQTDWINCPYCGSSLK